MLCSLWESMLKVVYTLACLAVSKHRHTLCRYCHAVLSALSSSGIPFRLEAPGEALEESPVLTADLVAVESNNHGSSTEPQGTAECSASQPPSWTAYFEAVSHRKAQCPGCQLLFDADSQLVQQSSGRESSQSATGLRGGDGGGGARRLPWSGRLLQQELRHDPNFVSSQRDNFMA